MIVKSFFLKNIFWNLSGYIVPIFAAVFSIPIIISNIGIERFGVLTLIFSMIGFMNIFDFGLTRSITNSVIKYKEEDNHNSVLSVINTGCIIIFSVALIISILIQLFSDQIVSSIFSVSKVIFDETKTSLSIIAISLPFVIIQGASVSVLEAFGHFKYISLTKTPFSILMYALPAVMSFISPTLVYVSISLCVLRIFMALSFWLLQRRIVSSYVNGFLVAENAKISFRTAGELLKYGGWVSVSNIIAPIMLYIDRFFVASIVGAGLVAYYTTPFEMISKMSILAVSVSGVLFPLLAKHLKTDVVIANSYYIKAMLGIGGSLLIPVTIGSIFSQEILSIWIDAAFAKQAWVVFCLFLVGFLIHGLIQPAYIWIQAAGKPYITALAHVFDLILYIIYFPLLTKQFGIIGAATAWIIRVSISMIVLNFIRYLFYKRGL